MLCVVSCRKRFLWLLVFSGIAVTGCGTLLDDLGGLFARPVLPDELAYVVNHEQDFAQDVDDPLRQVSAGTVVDDLGQLSGCWGAFDQFDFAGRRVDNYEAYRFDPTSGEMTWFGYAPDVLGFLPGAANYSGMFSVADESHIVFTVLEVSTINPATGDYETHDMPAGTQWTYSVTLDGNRLRMFWTDGPDDQPAERNNLVFRRFDCSE